MKNVLAAGLISAVFSAAILVMPAEASCGDNGTCSHMLRKAGASPSKGSRTKVARHSAHRVHLARKRHGRTAVAANSRSSGQVVSLITAMAPSYGVPTWFALRIAKVESNYNPNARGSAGELGVFQLKCQTARGIGYHGACSGLLNARTNVQYGLKHLSLAIKSSRGNLRLAASKHNGGLGRKKEVRGYVAMVF